MMAMVTKMGRSCRWGSEMALWLFVDILHQLRGVLLRVIVGMGLLFWE